MKVLFFTLYKFLKYVFVKSLYSIIINKSLITSLEYLNCDLGISTSKVLYVGIKLVNYFYRYLFLQKLIRADFKCLNFCCLNMNNKINEI